MRLSSSDWRKDYEYKFELNVYQFTTYVARDTVETGKLSLSRIFIRRVVY